MNSTTAGFFRTLVWLNLLCAMTLPGVVVNASERADDARRATPSAQVRLTSPRLHVAPTSSDPRTRAQDLNARTGLPR